VSGNLGVSGWSWAGVRYHWQQPKKLSWTMHAVLQHHGASSPPLEEVGLGDGDGVLDFTHKLTAPASVDPALSPKAPRSFAALPEEPQGPVYAAIDRIRAAYSALPLNFILIVLASFATRFFYVGAAMWVVQPWKRRGLWEGAGAWQWAHAVGGGHVGLQLCVFEWGVSTNKGASTRPQATVGPATRPVPVQPCGLCVA
jgi:hypothetical protein